MCFFNIHSDAVGSSCFFSNALIQFEEFEVLKMQTSSNLITHPFSPHIFLHLRMTGTLLGSALSSSVHPVHSEKSPEEPVGVFCTSFLQKAPLKQPRPPFISPFSPNLKF